MLKLSEDEKSFFEYNYKLSEENMQEIINHFGFKNIDKRMVNEVFETEFEAGCNKALSCGKHNMTKNEFIALGKELLLKNEQYMRLSDNRIVFASKVFGY